MASKKTAATEEAKPEGIEPVKSSVATEEKPKQKPKAGKKTAKAEAQAYIGPNLPGGKLFQYAVFKNGVPAYVQKLIDECSALKFLFVPVSRLSVARKNLGDKTSVEHAKFAEASRHFAKGAN